MGTKFSSTTNVMLPSDWETIILSSAHPDMARRENSVMKMILPIFQRYVNARLILLAEQLVKQRIECRVFSNDGLHDFPVRTDDNLRGESRYSIVGQKRRT